MEVNESVVPFPLKVILLVADAPDSTGMIICSLYGPLPASTLNITGPLTPQPNELIASANV